MALSIRKSALLVAVAAVVCLGVYWVLHTRKLVGDSLSEESARTKHKNEVAFELTGLTPHLTEDVAIIQTIAETRALAAFRGSVFAATSGGLAEFGDDGTLRRRYSVLDGLPESDLVALGVFRDVLFIGTRSKGVVTFDGDSFALYRFTDRKAQSINAFLATPGELLIGTFDGGLISFDGAKFYEVTPNETRIKGVTAISGGDSRLIVATFADGVWVREGAEWSHFTNAEGLPSNRVVAAFAHKGIVYAATDLGIAALSGDRFTATTQLANVTSAVVRGDQILLSTENGGIYSAERNANEIARLPGATRNARFAEVGESIFAISDNGVAILEGIQFKAFDAGETNSLSNNFVSAVAVDHNDVLWIGTFRQGIDVFSGEGRKLSHIETPDVREVNFINAGSTVRAATSKGLIEFDSGFQPSQAVGDETLANRSVTHFSSDFIATSKGLVHREKGKFKLLSAQNGLPSNSTYATLESGLKTYVGTLGGLAEIIDGRVARIYKDSNSNLDTNWVTALAEVRGRIFIGTYGGGLFELLPSGEIRSFRAETGKFVVNPNALATDGRRLFAGTLDGLRVLDLETQEWRIVGDVLPSQTVMSVCVSVDGIVVGTASGIARIRSKFFESL
ncbi:MAG: hypothetical protein IPJ30_09425 [Acidobacteria bacterium]|nr:hypothetical protein [Acidobacteriota bacterium]